MNTIISRAESLRILKNQLRKAALEKRSIELKDATAEERETVLAEIERDIEKQIQERQHTWALGFDTLLH